MSFVVANACIELGLRSGAVLFRNVEISARSPELQQEIAQHVHAIQAELADPAVIRTLPEVSAFQELLRKVGVNPRKVQPSLERLLNFVLKRGDLPAINSLVDAYNLVSVRRRLSLGAHDLDRIALPVELRPLTGAETFTPLGADQAVPVSAGEFGYVDGQNRLLCRLDVLQADFSKVTTETRNALLIIEGTAAHAPDVLRQAFAEATELITRFCGGTAEVVALPSV